MDLLKSYLTAVKRNLPRKQREDILAELSEELRSQIEDRERELGRPLTDPEQYGVLMQHGDPMVVARRYWPERSRSLAIGWELIGPELFPTYAFVLILNVCITLVTVLVALWVYHVPISIKPFLLPVGIQMVCVTGIFIVLNMVRRKFTVNFLYGPADLASMMPLQRWYSISGLVFCGMLTLWWLAIPRFQSLVLGPAAGELELSPSVWHRYHLPVLLLFLAGMAQRATTLARPHWNWLLPTSRFVIDGVGAVLMFFFPSHALVVVSQAAADPAQAERLAATANNWLRWGLFGPWLWIYLGASSLVYAWYSRPFLRRFLLSRRNRIARSQVNGLI
jgi:hypothetical protein